MFYSDSTAQSIKTKHTINLQETDIIAKGLVFIRGVTILQIEFDLIDFRF